MQRPLWKHVTGGAALVGTGAALLSHWRYRSEMAKAVRAHAAVAVPRQQTDERFDPSQVADLPEIAQRYFAHAIAPGTPLFSVALIEMEGGFLLGDGDKHRQFAMKAREVIRQPGEFVWLPRLSSGVITISGSDGLADGEAWARFWINRTLPIAQQASSPDMIRSAGFRGAAEAALWLPTTLLPRNGARWEEAGPDRARVTVSGGGFPVTLLLTLGPDGAVREMVGQRWSNANADKVFRLQPFGGTVAAERRFTGFTVPSEIAMGNGYGTPDYFPFFQARVTGISYR
nr:DUF6544 family protein [uncultured Sphingomonas sp.]